MIISTHNRGASAPEPSATAERTRLRGVVEAAQRAGESICVVHLDLDRFHLVNGRWGQEFGDRVLHAVHGALSAVLPGWSYLASVEGDTFVAMVPAGDVDRSRFIAELMLATVREPVEIEGVVLTLEASAGFAHHRVGEARGDLIEHAYLACRRAKATRRGSALAYEPELGVDVVAKLRTENAIRAAIARDELRLHLQPMVDLRDGRVTGVEALVRWLHPVDGLLSPAEFLPAADSAGLTATIGDWVLAEAIRLIGEWRTDHPFDPVRIWVNLAAEQLADGDRLIAQVRDAMRGGLIKAHEIGFEVTESSLLLDLPNAVGALSELRNLGLEIALDDFGTGYSSLTYLQQLPVTAVKIDRSFVSGIGGSLADEAIVEAVIDLAHALGLRVVAEGIECSTHAEALIRMGADEAQGFYFSHPLTPAEIGATLQQPWCGATPTVASSRPFDRRADDLPGNGSARARLLLTALDTVQDSILVTSAARTAAGSPPIVYVNPAFEAETGFSSADVIGKTIEILLAESDDTQTVAWFHSMHTGASAARREVASRRADGTTYLCEVTLSPILDERGIHTHWLHVRSNLTARRADARDRARFQGLIEQSSSLVSIAESGTGWVYANAAVRAALGIGPDDPLSDRRDLVTFGAEGRSTLSDEDRAALNATGRWSGPMTVTNQITQALTEVVTDIDVVEDVLRPGVKVYVIVSRDVTEINALERIARRRRELLSFAAELAQRALSQGRDELFDDFDNVLADCARLLRADFVYVDTIDVDAGVLRPLGSWQGDLCPQKDVRLGAVDIARLPSWIDHLRQGGVLSGGTTSNPTPWRTELAAVFGGPYFESYVYCGLNVDGVLVGAFGLARPTAEPAWTDDELATVQQIADTMANLLGRDRVDRARLASESHVNAILSNVRDIVVVVDRDGIVRYVNSQLEASTGHAPENILGQHFLHVIHPDCAQIAIARFADTIGGRPTLPITELQVAHADGTYQWYDVNTSGVVDPGLDGYVFSLRNVSGQHAQAEIGERRHQLEEVVLELSRWALNVEFEQIEAELTKHLQSLGELLDIDRAGAWLVDGASIRVAAHWTAEVADKKTPDIEVVDAPMIAERTRLPDVVIAVDDITVHDEEWADEWRSFPGHPRAALLVPLVSSGRSFGVVGVATMDRPRLWAAEERALVSRVAETVAALLARQAVEVSLRASEARLAALLDGSLDLVLVVTEVGEILYANTTARRCLGYAPVDMVGANIAEFVHADDLAMAMGELVSPAAVTEDEQTTLRLIARDGSFRWMEIMSGVVRDPVAGGKVLTCRDVTERHANEAAATVRVGHLRYAFDVAQAALDLDPEAFLATLPKLCSNISSMLRADFVYIDRIDEQAQTITSLGGGFREGAPQASRLAESLPIAHWPQWIDRLRRLDPLVVDDVAASMEPWALEKRNARVPEGGLLAIPMSAAGELLGVVGVSMKGIPRAWTDDEAAFLHIIGETIAHVLERARVDEALRRSETRFRLLSENAADVVLLLDGAGIIQYASPSSFGLLGFTPAELLGRNTPQMVHPDDVGMTAERYTMLLTGNVHTSEFRIERADGTFVWVASSTSAVLGPESGMPIEYRISLRDISDRKRLEAALEEQALRDPLTGLGNRILLQSRLRSATSIGSPAVGEVAVLLVDLDGFKAINDTYGHAVGDDALRVISSRLSGILRSQDTLARTGGDEFVAICPATSAQEAVKIGERIVRSVRQPLTINGSVVKLGASVGVAHHVGSTPDPGWLLIEADHAMYAAKREGRGRVRLAGPPRSDPRSYVALGA